jgi:hypothetical protein
VTTSLALPTLRLSRSRHEEHRRLHDTSHDRDPGETNYGADLIAPRHRSASSRNDSRLRGTRDKRQPTPSSRDWRTRVAFTPTLVEVRVPDQIVGGLGRRAIRQIPAMPLFHSALASWNCAEKLAPTPARDEPDPPGELTGVRWHDGSRCSRRARRRVRGEADVGGLHRARAPGEARRVLESSG